MAQKEKSRKVGEYREREQELMYESYKLGLREEFGECKNRAMHQQLFQKRKYHRLAKIY